MPLRHYRVLVIPQTMGLTAYFQDTADSEIVERIGNGCRYFETVPLVEPLRRRNLIGLVDEEGKIGGRQRFNVNVMPLVEDEIAGTMLVVRTRGAEFVSVSDGDYDVVRRCVDTWARSHRIFMNQGRATVVDTRR